jgi:phospholipid transport system substrate-binding protein
MLQRLFLLLILSGATAASAESIPSGNGSVPANVVGAFHESLISAMQASGFEERFAIVRPAVDSHFQIHTIARISLGRNWRAMSEDQQTDFIALMRELVATTYAARFDNWDDQIFETGTTESIGKNRVRIKSTLTTKKEVVTLDYQLQQVDADWKIYDIVANGVSDLSLKRSNYAAIFSQGGLAAVKAEIQGTITDNRTGNSE